MRGKHEPESLFWLNGKDWERRDQDPELSFGLNSLNNFGDTGLGGGPLVVQYLDLG